MKQIWQVKQKKIPKTIWKYIRSKQKTKESVVDLLTNQKNPKSSTTSDNKEKANIIADFFTNVFTVESEQKD